MSRFAVLVCGTPAVSVTKAFGTYGDMIVRLLRNDHEEIWRKYEVDDGVEIPSDLELAGYDGIVVSGSPKSVYDKEPWIESVAELIRGAAKRKQKTLGLCFGFQLVAHSLGGSVKPAPEDIGWEIGGRTVQVKLDQLRQYPYASDFASNEFNICQFHRDVVDRLPSDAHLLGSSLRCPHEIYAIENHILALQGHPEFAPDFVRAMVDARKDRLPPDVSKAAIDSFDTVQPPSPTASDNVLRHLCQSFLRS